MDSERTVITVKVDAGLKAAVQDKSETLGITISQVVNQALRDFLEVENYTFHQMKPETEKLIKKARAKVEAINEAESGDVAGLYPIRHHRKMYSFYDKGLRYGAKINFIRDQSIIVTVISDREVEFEGRRWKLSPLAKELHRRTGRLNRSGAYQGAAFFAHNGVKLINLPDVKE